MELLLKRDKLGTVLDGSDELLLERATGGDDLIAHEESSTFTCHIIFANYVVGADRVNGISLPHLAFGDLTDAERLEHEPLETIQYIYDSRNKNLLCRDVLDEGRTTASIYSNNPHYASFTWYSTRSYKDAASIDSNALKAIGDQFKIRLNFSHKFKISMKPDIIYFPEAGRDFLIKSSTMVLPTEFVLNPEQYIQTDRPLIANDTFSLAYLNIGSDNLLTIVHKQRFSINERMEEVLRRSIDASHPTPLLHGHQNRPDDSATEVTRLECEYTVLVPANASA